MYMYLIIQSTTTHWLMVDTHVVHSAPQCIVNSQTGLIQYKGQTKWDCIIVCILYIIINKHYNVYK